MDHKEIKGNEIISSKEEYIAVLLRKKNLGTVNQLSKKVVPRKGFYVRYGKRALDIVIAGFAMLLFSPVNLLLAAGTYLDVGSPLLFKQSRIGKGGIPFDLVKFRNMTNETDSEGKLLPAAKRVTRFGKFVREYSLDELLNFWSVLKGDMSVIGPRPLPVFYETRFSERHKMRSAVRPGLECPRVVQDKTIPPYQEQFENDIWYVEHVSLLTDIKMLFLLFKMTLNTGYRKTGSEVAGYFAGYDETGNATSVKRVCREHPEFETEYQNYLRSKQDSAKI